MMIKQDFRNIKTQSSPCHDISDLFRKYIYVGEITKINNERAKNGTAKSVIFFRLKYVVIIVI